MPTFQERLPDAGKLIALEPEELALVLLQVLNTQRGPHHARNFVLGLDQQGNQPYGQRTAEVQRAVMEAWSWLVNQGALVPDPQAHNSDFMYVARRGEKFLTDQTAAAQESIPASEPSAPTAAEEIPASDRVVALNDNDPERKHTIEVISKAIEAVRGDNEYASDDPEDREQRLAELEASKQLLKAPRISSRWLERIIGTLRFVVTKVRDVAIAMAVTEVIKFLVSLL